MKREIQIDINETPVGKLFYNQQGARENASFEYSADWLANADRYAIDPTLQLVSGPQFRTKSKDASIFHGAISDTEPDGWARRVINRDHVKRRDQARRTKTPFDDRPLNEMDYLLAVDDMSRIGALRMRDENGLYQRTIEGQGRGTPPLIELRHLLAATRAVELNKDTEADLAYLRGRGTSLGGMRPKCTIIDTDGHLAIGKFPSVSDERAVTKGEVLALNLAKMAGIRTADARIVDSDGLPVALIRRFDRTANGDRHMYVSAATMLGVDAADPDPRSYTEIVDVIRQNGRHVTEDIEELWRRIGFSILITNVDDHLHNHGFIHVENGLWTLSPTFDVNPFPDRVRELKTWISEEVGPDATMSALMSVLPYFKIKEARALQILGELYSAVSQWKDEAYRLGMTPEEASAFKEAFEHAETRAAQDLL